MRDPEYQKKRFSSTFQNDQIYEQTENDSAVLNNSILGCEDAMLNLNTFTDMNY